MLKRLLAVCAVFSITAGLLALPRDEAKKPNVAGAWTGVWGTFVPGKDGAPIQPFAKLQCAMDCQIKELPGGKWEATFEGECGKPYKYTIKMIGRQVDQVVMFQGTADLGKEDGGVFDWIGRAGDTDVTGFYTSKGYTGYFKLTRGKASGAK